MKYWQCFLLNYPLARDNLLLIDNYLVKALRTILLKFKELGELYDTYKEQIQSTMESDNPWIGMLMKSMGADHSIIFYLKVKIISQSL